MSLLNILRVSRELLWGGPLQQGSTGLGVRRLQEWLGLQGCRTAIDGEFGPATRASVMQFQTSRAGLEVTGEADLATLAELSRPLERAFGFAEKGATLRETMVSVARAHLAQRPREIGGDNRGPWVRAYCGQDGPAFRWCAGAALSVLQQSCALLGVEPLPVRFTLSCDELAASARAAKRFTSSPAHLAPGDLFLVRGQQKNDWIHTGLITAVHATYLETWEGNTNDDGSANGYEVCARTRGLTGKDFVLLG